jgi:hypothetical protein
VSAVIPVDVAQSVLWHFGDSNLGQQPGSFVSRLLVTLGAADEENREKLRAAFPELVRTWELAALHPFGVETLRAIVKGQLDAAEAGIDFEAVRS